MFRGSVLACAALFCLPSIWQAVITQNITVETAMVRFLVAVPVCAALLALVRLAMRRPESHLDAVAQNDSADESQQGN
jgi:hypothetical protein